MSALEAIERYGAAVAVGDMDAVASVFTSDAVWHQPGENPLSGDHVGPIAILDHLGRFMALSQGSFTLTTESATESGALVSTTVRFTATRADGATLDQRGVDVFRVVDGRIAEVWLIGEDQVAEDEFWSGA